MLFHCHAYARFAYDSFSAKATHEKHYINIGSGAHAIKKFTPSLGIPYLGV